MNHQQKQPEVYAPPVLGVFFVAGGAHLGLEAVIHAVVPRTDRILAEIEERV